MYTYNYQHINKSEPHFYLQLCSAEIYLANCMDNYQSSHCYGKNANCDRH